MFMYNPFTLVWNISTKEVLSAFEQALRTSLSIVLFQVSLKGLYLLATELYIFFVQKENFFFVYGLSLLLLPQQKIRETTVKG